MSVTLSIRAFSGKESPEFQKHFKAVQFCLENQLSFPKETSEFFKGKVEGEDLDKEVEWFKGCWKAQMSAHIALTLFSHNES